MVISIDGKVKAIKTIVLIFIDFLLEMNVSFFLSKIFI